MRETWNAARVGLMVALGLVVTFAVYRYVDERSTTESGYGVYAYFDDVQGLVAKSRVLVAGTFEPPLPGPFFGVSELVAESVLVRSLETMGYFPCRCNWSRRRCVACYLVGTAV